MKSYALPCLNLPRYLLYRVLEPLVGTWRVRAELGFRYLGSGVIGFRA